MPTGYTAAIYEEKDVEFRDFALKCARAFGPLWGLRDTPNAAIPESFDVPDYYLARVEKAEKELVAARNLSLEDAARQAKDLYDERIEHARAGIERAERIRRNYEDMLAQVEAWVPPTEEHQELKNFMKEQLVDSIKADTDTSYYTKVLENSSIESAEEYKDMSIKIAEDSVVTYKRVLEEQIELAKFQNSWVSGLLDSL